MPTSVTHFFNFAGVKIWRGGRSHKQWGVGIPIPLLNAIFRIYIYTKQCGLCGLAGYLRVLSIFYSLISMCWKIGCLNVSQNVTRKTFKITRKPPPNNPQTHQESGSSDATERLNRVTFCCLVVVCGSAILTRKVSCMWLCVHQLRRNGVFRFNGTGMTNMIAPSPENGFSCFGKMDT